MTTSREEALDALSVVEATSARVRILRGYRVGGPVLMLWGAIWAAGFGGMGLLPMGQWGRLWLFLNIAGVSGSLWLARGRGSAVGISPWRMLLWSLISTAFVVATCFVMQPREPAAAMAFAGLFISLVYGAAGLLGPLRYLGIGLFMFALTLIGYFAFRPWLPFWLAACSAGLFLSGLWLWKR